MTDEEILDRIEAELRKAATVRLGNRGTGDPRMLTETDALAVVEQVRNEVRRER